MKILIAEDDLFTRNGLSELFREEGYDVCAAEDGEKAAEIFPREKPDLVILDIMMPRRNGYDVCRTIRGMDPKVPVIFLSAKSEEIDKVLGLELGADDYISKPFGVKEVLARVRAVLRRSGAFAAAGAGGVPGAAGSAVGRAAGGAVRVFEMGDLRVYPEELRALRGNEEIDLGPRDVKLLLFFAENRGKVLDRDVLYNAGWSISHLPNSRTLDQHIAMLRKKIERDPKEPAIITTVHTAGYRYP